CGLWLVVVSAAASGECNGAQPTRAGRPAPAQPGATGQASLQVVGSVILVAPHRLLFSLPPSAGGRGCAAPLPGWGRSSGPARVLPGHLADRYATICGQTGHVEARAAHSPAGRRWMGGQAMAAQVAWNQVLRALREAGGVTQEGWAAQLGLS